MFIKLSAAIKGLSLKGPFSNIGKTIRTDGSFSRHRTLKSSMDNHDTQPLRYLAEESKPPFGSQKQKMDVQKHQRMGQLEDRRILDSSNIKKITVIP